MQSVLLGTEKFFCKVNWNIYKFKLSNVKKLSNGT